MTRRKYEFSDDDKVKVLLWCARHCCLCGKFAGVGIEVAHLDKRSNNIDDAIPLCFDCHAAIGHYNNDHPRGKKYTINELKARRDQVYEEHTVRLLSPVSYEINNETNKFPRIDFVIAHEGYTYPLQARVTVTIYVGKTKIGTPGRNGQYSGIFFWNLNPREQTSGVFSIPNEYKDEESERFKAKVDLTLVDIYKREHRLLPRAFIRHPASAKGWYAEPCMEALDT